MSSRCDRLWNRLQEAGRLKWEARQILAQWPGWDIGQAVADWLNQEAFNMEMRAR